MKKILFILFFTLMLQGCVPAVFVAGAATGTIIYDHRTTKAMVEDRDITFRVQSKLNKDEELRTKAHVSITTFNHIALLLGQAPDESLREKAESIAKANSKVKMLYNEIKIGKPISDLARANDSWITAKVKTVLVTVPGINSSTLKVITEDKVVYLMGLTTKAQADLATKKTRTVAGVKKVVKLFEYLN